MPKPTITEATQLPGMCSVDEFAAYTGMCRTTAIEFIKQPGFPMTRAGRKYLIPRDAMLKWFANQRQQGSPDGRKARRRGAEKAASVSAAQD